MKFKSLLFVTLSLFLISPVSAQLYTIDPGHSSVSSSVQRFGAVNVVGRFKDVSGTINYDPSDITKTTANVVIVVDSYDANNSGGEGAVKSAAFLDAANFPEIKFSSTSAYEKDGTNYIVGDLTIHGVTKQVEFPFKSIGPVIDMPTQKQSIAILAKLTINRQDFGLSFDRRLKSGGSFIGNDVGITLNVLGIAQ
jgi:polyisoprenoid-binding protein YceI